MKSRKRKRNGHHHNFVPSWFLLVGAVWNSSDFAAMGLRLLLLSGRGGITTTTAALSWSATSCRSVATTVVRMTAIHNRNHDMATSNISNNCNASHHCCRNHQTIAVVGGGLAGLAVSYHLLEQCRRRSGHNMDGTATGTTVGITVYDRTTVGDGGASAVAGGYVRAYEQPIFLVMDVSVPIACMHAFIQFSVEEDTYIYLLLLIEFIEKLMTTVHITKITETEKKGALANVILCCAMEYVSKKIASHSFSFVLFFSFLLYTCTLNRLLHPLSPKGKLVHWGLEGLAATNRLIAKACEAEEEENKDHGIVLRRELYRVVPVTAESADANRQQQQLQQTAGQFPHIAEWLEEAELKSRMGSSGSVGGSMTSASEGGLRLHNGCCVLHVPSYLRGLWKACQLLARGDDTNGSSIEWRILEDEQDGTRSLQRHLDEDFDVTVYCGGAGMFSQGSSSSATAGFLSQSHFPVQLVRGQSLELVLPHPQSSALLCGKYISPMPSNKNSNAHMALVGATHEFQHEPLSKEQVIAELKERTVDMSPLVWKDYVVDRVTSGIRVQSARGPYGRRPILGRLPLLATVESTMNPRSSDNNNNSRNAWAFTGLSSRGLLYHALYGEMLASAILSDCEDTLLERCPDMLWWKK